MADSSKRDVTPRHLAEGLLPCLNETINDHSVNGYHKTINFYSVAMKVKYYYYVFSVYPKNWKEGKKNSNMTLREQSLPL
jgi:hypothetical protein